MATYNDLETDKYYLIKEEEDDAVDLVYVLMETKNAIYLEVEDGDDTLVWKKKSASIAEIVDELTEDEAELYESIAYEDDDDDDDFEWDDEDEDDGVIPIHN
ncbi:MAG: hypothetical protein ABIX01_00605 [Chitinophagaceae bacterium]